MQTYFKSIICNSFWENDDFVMQDSLIFERDTVSVFCSPNCIPLGFPAYTHISAVRFTPKPLFHFSLIKFHAQY